MDNALYFPFISVPENAWFTRILLYWDRVGSITPFEFVKNPELLSAYTRDLLTDELLVQILPEQYVWRIPRFGDAFIEFMESLSTEDLRRRREIFQSRDTVRIHVDKMWELADYLIDAQLAVQVNPSWCDVEVTTAGEFMGYLAVTLGKQESVKSTPVTNHPANLEPFLRASKAGAQVEPRLSPLRTLVLENLLPVPEKPVPVSKLRSFKGRHGDNLRHFRHAIEQEVSNMADMTNPDLQSHRLQNFIAEKKDEACEIAARLSEGGLGKVVLSKVSAIISTVPGVNALVGLASAVYAAYPSSTMRPMDGAFMYAAYVKTELG